MPFVVLKLAGVIRSWFCVTCARQV